MNILIYVTSLFVLMASIGCTAVIAYVQSFTDSTFGGYMGVALPVILVLLTFIAGYCANDSCQG